MDENLLYWVWLSKALGVSNGKFIPILTLYKTPQIFYNSLKMKNSLNKNLLTPKEFKKLNTTTLNEAEKIIEDCVKFKCKIVKYIDDVYPRALRKIYAPPALLYIKGNIDILRTFEQTCAICIVGSRKSSEYGMAVTKHLTKELCLAGMITVSGFASGIDTVVHKTTLDCNCKTIAIVGCGINVNYPKSNEQLKNQMLCGNGLILSEYPPNWEVRNYNFPIRNRIMAGISNGVLITEAGEKSGSLITANLALEQGKEVYSVPHSIGNKSAYGSNTLIKDGATVVTEANDIIFSFKNRYDYLNMLKSNKRYIITKKEYKEQNELNHRKNTYKTSTNEPNTQSEANVIMHTKHSSANLNSMSITAKKIYENLKKNPICIDDIVLKLNENLSNILVAITELEFANMIKTYPGSRYSLKT